MVHSDAEVRAIKADGRRRIFRVSGARGLRLDVRKRARTWAILYRTRSGRVRTYVLGRYPEMTLATARAAAREVRARVDLGQDPMAERLEARAAERERQRVEAAGGALTIGRLARRMLAEADEPAEARPLKLEESTLYAWRGLARRDVIPTFGDRRPETLTRKEIRSWGSKTVRVRGPYQANRAFELLRRVYSWAIEQDLVEVTPFVKLARPFGDEEASDRVLSTDEIRWVWRALGEGPYPDVVRLLFLTGVRREMVVGMPRAELDGLDGEEPRWTVPASRTKGDRPHVVPLSSQAVKVIKRRMTVALGEQVFPPVRALAEATPPKGASMTWSSKWVERFKVKIEELRMADAAERMAPPPEPMPRWTIHNIRHTVGTHMREDLGIDRDVVSMILLHAPGGPAVTRVYDRAEMLPERRAALQAWADWVEALTK